MKLFLNRMWNEFITMVGLITGDDFSAGIKPNAEGPDTCTISDSQNPAGQIAPADLNCSQDSIAQEEQTADQNGNLDDYYDEIDGFMNKIEDKPSEPAPVDDENKTALSRRPEQN